MAEFATWQDQHCAGCESALFVPLLVLSVKPGGGTVTRQAGYQCAKCSKIADIAEMQAAAHLREKRRELEALEKEIASVAPAATSSGKK